MLARIYQSEATYRERIEQTAPCSEEREKVVEEMYAKSWLFTLPLKLSLNTPATRKS